MVYTVTFNPSLDHIVAVDDFKLGKTNRTVSESMLPGGKGLNVSIVLSDFGIDNTAVFFSAGFVGKEIKGIIEHYGIKTNIIDIPEGNSRINFKLSSIDGTEINGMGPNIPDDKLEELLKDHKEDIKNDITKEKNVAAYRAKVGMCFQSFNLLSNMTALTNCMVGPMKV